MLAALYLSISDALACQQVICPLFPSVGRQMLDMRFSIFHEPLGHLGTDSDVGADALLASLAG